MAFENLAPDFRIDETRRGGSRLRDASENFSQALREARGYPAYRRGREFFVSNRRPLLALVVVGLAGLLINRARSRSGHAKI